MPVAGGSHQSRRAADQKASPILVTTVADSIIEASVSSKGVTNATLKQDPAKETCISATGDDDSVFQINQTGGINLNSERAETDRNDVHSEG